MEQSKKKITIITVVKNSEATIERCIKSVLSQNYKNIEYIIIDGNSSDGTKEIINKYRDQISKIIIGDDGGIWEAMNKGINLASGEILGFLNSDDYYYEKTTEIVNNYFSNNNIDFLFGSVEKYKLMHGYSPWKVPWSFGFYTSHSVGFFIKTKKHLDVGLYNSRYLSADLDFFYKMIIKYKMQGMSSKKNEVFGKFQKGGFSSKIRYLDHLLDLNKIRIDNNQNALLVYLLFIIKIIKKPIKFLNSLFK
ncbi:glycosyltransferase [Candidatus Pelagibacter bacterium]|nr:glycosyltransferase [Candidatus Pelagibacter bacterium]